MSTPYRIFGSENSPYSVKVRSYLRYKGIPHEWLLRHRPENNEEFQKHARLPLVPLVVTPDGRGIQDSTPIIETLEPEFPEPGIHPPDSVAAFVSVLLEEFGDEWGNKWMFHYRWRREVDQVACSERLVAEMMPQLDETQRQQMAGTLRERMVGRVWFVGSSDQTAPQIEQSFQDSIQHLEAHLAGRPYLFGARPAFADFGLWGQIYNASLDPTPGAILREDAPGVLTWVERMLEPKAEGDFEAWDALAPTLTPLLEEQVGGRFLPWSQANARALAADREEFSVELPGGTWTQKPQKYHAKSLAALRAKYAEARSEALDALLERTGCLTALRDA